MEKRYERRLRRYTAVFLWIGLLGLIATFIVLSLVRVSPSGRMTVLVASDPVVVWSWDSEGQSSVIVAIPADTAVSAVRGYGQYPLSSLWRLGGIDHREQAILPQTASETLGVSIPWYIGFSPSELVRASDPQSILSRVFSPAAIPSFLRGTLTTNMSFVTYLQFVRALGSVSDGKTKRLDIDRSNVLVESQLPDGSKVQTIDPDRLELFVGDSFEEARVRSEALRVAVLNATRVPGLADRFARFVARLGATVILVGNSDQNLADTCLVIGSQSRLTGSTAVAIKKISGCKTSASTEGDGRADLTVLVGEGYAP